jgi:DNA processing protein
MNSEPTLFDSEPEFSTPIKNSDPDSLMQTGWIRALLNLPGVGPKRAITIITKVMSAERLIELPKEDLYKLTRIDVEIPKTFAQINDDLPGNIRLIGFFDEDYPIDFRELPDAPLLIWCRGDLPSGKMLTVVGTRHPTTWGEKVAAAAGEICASLAITTVSGLALGIDGTAHQSSLLHKGKTVAILGSGVDRVTPSKHSKLADEIVESGGCLISEVPLGTDPSAGTLVSRNRLQAALGTALLMVQCGIPSGTLHTVRFARNLGRLIAVPVPPVADNAVANSGNSALLSSATVGNGMLGKLGIPLGKTSHNDMLADLRISGLNELGAFIQGL